MDILAGRWKVFILWEQIQGPRRSGELRKSIPPITQKVFVEQLRDLEDNGLVKRTVFPTVRREWSTRQRRSVIRFAIS